MKKRKREGQFYLDLNILHICYLFIFFKVSNVSLVQPSLACWQTDHYIILAKHGKIQHDYSKKTDVQIIVLQSSQLKLGIYWINKS